MSAYRPPSAINLLPHTSKCVYLQDDIDRGMLSAREILIVKKLSKYVWYGASPNAKNMLHFGDIFPCIPIMAAPPEIRLTMAQTRPCFFQTRVAGFRVCNQFSTPSVLDALAWSFFAQIRFFQSLILKKRKKNIGYLVVAISSPWPVVVSGGIVLHIDGTARARYRSKWWRFYIFREDSENRLNRRENSPLWVILKNAFPLTRGIVLSTILRKDGKIFARVFLWGYFVQV